MVYIIKGGDTLFKIAQKYTGNGNRYPEVLDLNPQIKNPDFIREGDMLNLPDSWGGGSSNVPATQPEETVSEDSGMSVNTKVMLVAGIAALGAGLYWYMGQQKAAQNPEEDEEEEFEDEDEE